MDDLWDDAEDPATRPRISAYHRCPVIPTSRVTTQFVPSVDTIRMRVNRAAKVE